MPWNTLLVSVLLHIAVPMIAGVLTRRALLRQGGKASVDAFRERLKAFSVIALMATVTLIVGFQGETVIGLLVIAVIVLPLLAQFQGASGGKTGRGWTHRWDRHEARLSRGSDDQRQGLRIVHHEPFITISCRPQLFAYDRVQCQQSMR